MNPLHALFLVLIGLGAGFVQRVSGFGLGIFSMIFLPHFLPSHTAAATISSLFSCVTSLYNGVKYRKNVAYKMAFPMICAALVSIPIAVHFSAVVSDNTFQILLGVMLIILSLYFVVFHKNITLKPTVSNGILAGALGGTLGGLFSTGGPPVVLYLSCAIQDGLTYFATIQFYFCFTNFYAVAVRVMNGFVNTEVLIYATIGVIGCMIGDFIGKIVFDSLDSNKLKLVIYIGMIISGVVMLF